MTALKNQLTIVIPCKNEGLNITRTLRYLNKQQDIHNTKVIIADSSDDNGYTKRSIYGECDKNIDIQIIPGGYPAIARNNGAELSKTKYILFLDADMFITKNDLLRIVVNEMEKHNLDLLTTKIRTTNGEFDYVYRIFDIIQFFIKFTTPFAVGGFMLFNKEAFDKHKFNSEDKISEDYHLSSKISPKKFRISNHKIYTLSRRFKNKGVWYMVKLMIRAYLNKNNNKFFETEYDYWK
jgi:glycosyltransferase involved in cell wall biosynthesis